MLRFAETPGVEKGTGYPSTVTVPLRPTLDKLTLCQTFPSFILESVA